MIKQHQRQLSQLNGALDALSAFAAMMLAFVIRFYLRDDGAIAYGVASHVLVALGSAALHLVVYSAMGFYKTHRSMRYYAEIWQIVVAESLCFAIVLSVFYFFKLPNFSRAMLGYSYALGIALCVCKRMTIRLMLRAYRRRGFNQKHVVLVGCGSTAADYLRILDVHREYGFRVAGYVADDASWGRVKHLGGYDALEDVLNRLKPDEAVLAMAARDYTHIEDAIRACEKTGTPLSIIPCYDRYISSRMQVEEIDGLNVVGIRSIPLDNLMNAAIKRTIDVVGSLALLVLTSPLMLAAAVGIRLTSPGPVIFRQERVGRAGQRLEQKRGRAAHALWLLPAQVQHRRAAAADQRAQGRHEPGGPAPGDPLLRRQVQGGSPAVYDQALRPPGDHRLGAGVRVSRRYVDSQARGARHLLYRALDAGL